MKNFEYYKKELNDMFDYAEIRCVLCILRDGKCKKHSIRDGCDNCFRKSLEWLMDDYKDKIKLKKWEYDLLESSSYKESEFEAYIPAHDMKLKGYFKGIADTAMTIKEILENCEVENE